ncbi:MAG: DHHW family protein [Eubacteriales bacterium]|nr:DHHW family protein [Eubacteriales bacterium]
MSVNLKHEKRLAVVFFLIIGLMFASIAVRTVTRQVLIKRMGLDNVFTRAVFFDQYDLKDTKEAENEEDTPKVSNIKWYELYPFPAGTSLPEGGAEEGKETLYDKLSKSAKIIKGNTEVYCTDFLPGYSSLVSAAKYYEQTVGWNYVDYTEYNGVITLSDGYLSGAKEKIDVTVSAEAAEQLSDFCTERGIEFLYVQYPHKNCVYQDADICGIRDFYNQNADDFLSMLQEKNIPTLDLRHTLHDEGLDHHAAFFRTDHHWKPETGLWAAQKMLEYMNDLLGCDFDSKKLNKENFEFVLYPKCFLGSQGKKKKLPEWEYDDLYMVYPRFDTDFSYSVPSCGVDLAGNFSIMYDDERIAYHTYNYGDQPLNVIQNNGIQKETKLLIVHDSFTDVVAPFLGLSIQEVDAIDLRHFNGSLKSYIEAEKPDIVVLAYNPSVLTDKIDLTNHDNLFDFR